MRIRLGLISGTWMTLAGFISRPREAGLSNPASDLVETTSPGHHSPSTPSDLAETTSSRPRYTPKLAKALSLSYYSSHRLTEVLPLRHQTMLGLKEVLFPSLRATATWCSITHSHSHAQLILTSSSK